jgi:uncharacterized protein
MIYLLDVNVLLALGYQSHNHYDAAMKWLHSLYLSEKESHQLATCAITELGFVRVATGPAKFAVAVAAAKSQLRRMKARYRFVFLGDELDADALPEWVMNSKQTTDGHLLELAAKHGARLATFDKSIPGALLISSAASQWRLHDVDPVVTSVV